MSILTLFIFLPFKNKSHLLHGQPAKVIFCFLAVKSSRRKYLQRKHNLRQVDEKKNEMIIHRFVILSLALQVTNPKPVRYLSCNFGCHHRSIRNVLAQRESRRSKRNQRPYSPTIVKNFLSLVSSDLSIFRYI